MRAARIVCVLSVLLGAATMAGCVTTTNDPGQTPAATFRSTEHYGLDWERVDLPDTITPGTERTWHLRAVNEGPPGENEFTYREGCGEPWTITLTGPDGNEKAWMDDTSTCQGFEEKTFVGGETKDFRWSWDGRLWNGQGFEDAPEGAYTLAVGFEAAHAGIHEGAAIARTTFHVV